MEHMSESGEADRALHPDQRGGSVPEQLEGSASVEAEHSGSDSSPESDDGKPLPPPSPRVTRHTNKSWTLLGTALKPHTKRRSSDEDAEASESNGNSQAGNRKKRSLLAGPGRPPGSQASSSKAASSNVMFQSPKPGRRPVSDRDKPPEVKSKFYEDFAYWRSIFLTWDMDRLEAGLEAISQDGRLMELLKTGYAELEKSQSNSAVGASGILPIHQPAVSRSMTKAKTQGSNGSNGNLKVGVDVSESSSFARLLDLERAILPDHIRSQIPRHNSSNI